MQYNQRVLSYPEIVQAVWKRKDYDMRGRKVSAGMAEAICDAQDEVSHKAGVEEGWEQAQVWYHIDTG